MSSSSSSSSTLPSEITDMEKEGLQVRIKLYKQIKDQLLAELDIYHKQKKEELAKIISDSI
jgi:predicted DNA-binding antitoxin AbrB/MazE fold protein